MFGPFVHNIDPIVGRIGPFYLWWYGLSYTFGFLGVLTWLRRNRQTLSFTMHQVYNLTLLLSVGVLVGGRLVEVVFYEWAYYRSHLHHIPAIWLGGMSTHGILLGAVIGIFLFCRLNGRSFFEVGDVLAIAGAYIMGVGRIGNFIDGQIAGSVTEVAWAVKFPDLEGFRHPVVLYDGIKNLLLIPLLLMIRKRNPPQGVIVAHFLLWYGCLRIFIDFFREYRTTLYGLPPGQEFNVFMTLLGLSLLVWFYTKNRKQQVTATLPTGLGNPGPCHGTNPGGSVLPQRIVFIFLLLVVAIIPSDWTQDIPARYGERHPGLEYSVIYPRIDVAVGLE